MYVRREYGSFAGIASMPDVRDELCAPSKYEKDEDGRLMPVSGLAHTAMRMGASDYAPLRAKGSRFMQDNREINSIISTAMTQSRFLDSLDLRDDMRINGVDFSDLKRETVTVYVIIPANRLRTHAGWLRLVIETALRSMYATPNQAREPVMFIIDEAAAIGYMAALEDAAGIARGYQVQLILCLQDLNQIQSLYQRRWQTFIANAGALIAFAPRDHFTAKYLSDLSGHRTQLVRSMSSGSSQQGTQGGSSSNESFNIAPQAVPRYRPEELMGMGRGNAILFTDHLERCAMIPTPEYMAIPEVMRHIRPNPYYTGQP
jgi:type IV secretion system protein VirD4